MPSDSGRAPAPALFEGGRHLDVDRGLSAVFLQAHLRGLRGQDGWFLKAATVRDLHTPDGRYALGWGIQDFAGARSSLSRGRQRRVLRARRDPALAGLAVALLTNDGRDETESGAPRSSRSCSRRSRSLLTRRRRPPCWLMSLPSVGSSS